MRRFALLALLLTVLPGCGFTKAIGIGVGAIGITGTIAGFVVLDQAGKHASPDPDPGATRTEYRASAGLIAGGVTLALLGAGLYLLADTIEKDLEKSKDQLPEPATGEPKGAKEGSGKGEYEIRK
ncbi:MAG: hypothetical protein QM820_60350 [Minicystis sp.]